VVSGVCQGWEGDAEDLDGLTRRHWSCARHGFCAQQGDMKDQAPRLGLRLDGERLWFIMCDHNQSCVAWLIHFQVNQDSTKSLFQLPPRTYLTSPPAKFQLPFRQTSEHGRDSRSSALGASAVHCDGRSRVNQPKSDPPPGRLRRRNLGPRGSFQ
jgi:hypothetical protein